MLQNFRPTPRLRPVASAEVRLADRPVAQPARPVVVTIRPVRCAPRATAVACSARAAGIAAASIRLGARRWEPSIDEHFAR